MQMQERAICDVFAFIHFHLQWNVIIRLMDIEIRLHVAGANRPLCGNCIAIVVGDQAVALGKG